MVDKNVKFNYVILVSVFFVIFYLGVFELGKWVYLYVDKNGIEIDDVFGFVLIDMYFKCGSVDKVL